MIVKFEFNSNLIEEVEFEEGTTVDEIEEYYEDWLFNTCAALEVFDDEGLSPEEYDETLKSYGSWEIIE